jgi:hypothetical protein
MRVIYACILLILLPCCYNSKDDYATVKGQREGYIPIYSDTFPDLRDTIKSFPPQNLSNIGKIHVYLKWLFINEPGEGIHVYDNSISTNPPAVCFIRIPGNYDISCKDSILYAESSFGLVHFNISNLPAIKDIKFMDTAYSKYTGAVYNYPSFEPIMYFEGIRGSDSKTFFECVDPSKGYVVGWKYGIIKDPKCHKEYNTYYE